MLPHHGRLPRIGISRAKYGEASDCDNYPCGINPTCQKNVETLSPCSNASCKKQAGANCTGAQMATVQTWKCVTTGWQTEVGCPRTDPDDPLTQTYKCAVDVIWPGQANGATIQANTCPATPNGGPVEDRCYTDEQKAYLYDQCVADGWDPADCYAWLQSLPGQPVYPCTPGN